MIIIISMSIGMICCLVAFILIGIVIYIMYKHRSKCINHPIVIGMSAISLIIAVTTAIYLCCNGGCFGISNIDYGDTSVTVLTTIIGLLVGWNIYSVIDTKSLIKKHEILKRKSTHEIGKLKILIREQDTERTKLRRFVNIVQNFTMANVRMTEKRYGDALGIYCNAAIELYYIIRDDESKWNDKNDEFDLMQKCIVNADNIVRQDWDIKNSNLLTDMCDSIIKGLKGINYDKIKDVKARETLNAETQRIIEAIEKASKESQETNNPTK